MLNQYGIAETSSMGQIIEQEDELHDVSIDKGDQASQGLHAEVASNGALSM